jgi:glycosyltransferase involved in cell wall biosynthesis
VRAAVSAEFVRAGQVGGTEQALIYVLRGLAANLAEGDQLLVIGESLGNPVPGATVLPAPRPARPRFLQETLSHWALGETCDAYYFPNYFTPPVRRCRVITTIPDLQYLHLPENFSRRKRAWLAAAHRLTLRRADVVTVYTACVREDIRSRYGESAASKVVVLPIPVDWERFGVNAHPRPTGRPYVLTVASHYRHKNLATLVRAFRMVREREPDVHLVMAGQLGARLIGVRQAEDVRELIRRSRLEDHVRVTGYVTDSELGALYRGASVFAFPSVFEGFGLPPVEALGIGLPVITTRCTSLPEVTRGLADYVDDPFDAEELAAQIVRRLRDGARPSGEAVANLRSYYDPGRLGRRLSDLFAGGSS